MSNQKSKSPEQAEQSVHRVRIAVNGGRAGLERLLRDLGAAEERRRPEPARRQRRPRGGGARRGDGSRRPSPRRRLGAMAATTAMTCRMPLKAARPQG